MGKNIYTDRNQMELKQHGTVDFPVHIGIENIFEYDNKRFNCHWHKEVEIAFVLEGKMVYRVNETEYTISAGDALFVNANALHMGWSIENQPCSYHAITFDPSILAKENGKLRFQYIDSILDSGSFTSYVFRPDNNWQKAFLDEIRALDSLFLKKEDCYEMMVISGLLKAWSLFYRNTFQLLQQQNSPNKRLDKIKSILSFLHENYTSKITLDDISRSANISKSECSHFFKQYMHETPFEYLLRYRIAKSLPILLDENKNITEAALAVGFFNASYYTEIFKRIMGISPKTYKSNPNLLGNDND